MNVTLRLVALLTLAWQTIVPATTFAQNAIADEGIFVSVPNPLTSEAVTRIKNRVEAARANVARPIRKVVFDFNPTAKDATTTDYGTCYDLASYITRLHDLGTIGFVSANVNGHAVLPVLACKELVVAKGASLGEILTETNPTPLQNSVKTAYEEVLGKSRESQLAIVKKMYDRGVLLGKGTKGGVDFYVDLREKETLKKQGVTISDPTPLPITSGVLNANQLKTFGMVATMAENRKDVAELYSLSSSSLREDPLNGRPPVAFHLILEGAITGGMKESVGRTVEDVIRQKGNVLFLELRCSGGDISAARDLADKLVQFQKGENGLLIVAYVPKSAPDTAAVVAMGCTEIVMSKRKDAKLAGDEERESVFGDFEQLLEKDANRGELLKKNLAELATEQGFPTLLIDGMVDRDIVIVRAKDKVDPSKRRLMTEAEFDTNKAKWQSDGIIKPKGQLLKLNATRAVELGIARFTTDNSDIKEAYALYGVEVGKVHEATPGWLDRFGAWIRLPTVTVLLAVIGFAGLMLELKVPGVTIPGIVAALCFILIFWSHSQYSGQTAILGGLIFLLGLLLLLLEFFVIPGFGVTGLLGLVFIIGGVGLATVDRMPETSDDWTNLGSRMGMFFGAMVVAFGAAFTIAKFLPQIPYANRMVLQPPSDDPSADPIADLPGAALAISLLGAIGTAATALRPSGMAQFGEQYVDVITEGGFIPAGAKLQVVEVEGTRIVVKEI